MASSSLIATCKRRGRYIHVSAPIIPVEKKDPVTGIVSHYNTVGVGRTYRKKKEA